MPSFVPDEVIGVLATNSMTAVFFDRQGRIVELLRIEEKLTPDFVVDIAKQRKESVFRFVVRGTYTIADIDGWALDALKGFELSDQSSGPSQIALGHDQESRLA